MNVVGLETGGGIGHDQIAVDLVAVAAAGACLLRDEAIPAFVVGVIGNSASSRTRRTSLGGRRPQGKANAIGGYLSPKGHGVNAPHLNSGNQREALANETC